MDEERASDLTPALSGHGNGALTRRQAMRRGASALTISALLAGGISARLLATQGDPTQHPGETERFMSFSKLSTGHDRLDGALGLRLYAALTRVDRTFPAKLKALDAFVTERRVADVEALDLALKRQSDLHDAMLSVIRAWYSGVVEEGTGATVYAYEAALMYQPARDQVVIPTYAHDGPNYWVRPPASVSDMPAF